MSTNDALLLISAITTGLVTVIGAIGGVVLALMNAKLNKAGGELSVIKEQTNGNMTALKAQLTAASERILALEKANAHKETVIAKKDEAIVKVEAKLATVAAIQEGTDHATAQAMRVEERGA